MFLDDQLYQKVKSKEINSITDFEHLVNELYDICEDYFKLKLSSNMTYKEGTQLMDRVFKLWDMFILKLEKDNWPFITVLKHESYKKAFMNNESLKIIYEEGL